MRRQDAGRGQGRGIRVRSDGESEDKPTGGERQLRVANNTASHRDLPSWASHLSIVTQNIIIIPRAVTQQRRTKTLQTGLALRTELALFISPDTDLHVTVPCSLRGPVSSLSQTLSLFLRHFSRDDVDDDDELPEHLRWC